jgi:hypothetical protein
MNLTRWPRWLLLGAVCAALVGAGCRSTHSSDPDQFASVDIQDCTPMQIRLVAVQIFQAGGFQVSQAKGSNLLFEKKGSAMNNFAYGNWMEQTVWVRVKAAIVPLSETRYRLQCDAFMVRDRGGATEEQILLHHFQNGPYQELLDKVAQQLNPVEARPRSN